MKLYGSDFSPNSNKVRFALNAMDIDYEFQSVDLAGGEQRTDAFKKIAPVGRIPVLTDGAFTIFESNAIMRYAAEKAKSPLYPQDLQKHSVVNQWLDFGAIHVGGAMGKMLFNTIIYKMVNAAKDENSLKEGHQFMANFLKIIDAQLAQTAFICGADMTLADLTILAHLDPCEVVGFDVSAYPKVAAWRKKLQSQAFYKEVFISYTEYLAGLMAKA